MITCKLKHLEARCRQRGYTLDEVRECIVSQDGDDITVDESHPKYPRPLTVAKKAVNFAKSSVKHIATGMKRCSQEEVNRRFAICQGCEFLKDGACMKCGCPVVREKKFISKLSWANESCPIGKWGNGK